MKKQKRDAYDPHAIVHSKHISPDAENFDELLRQHRPREAAVRQQYGMNRRTFMKLMGGSLALAGFGAVGCTARPSEEKIVPYVQIPEEVVPGKPLVFASAMTLGGYATGVLIETYEGRPTRIDGNPAHPASQGASNVFVQGSILELYNPERMVEVRQNGAPRTLADFKEAMTSVSDANGDGVRILTQTVTSPTLVAQINTLLEQYPGAKWYQYEPLARNNVVMGSQMAFGEVVNTTYDFSKADVVLSIDGDFLNNMPGSLHYTRNFTARRKVRGNVGEAAMNRLYMVESTPTITGASADHRLALRPSQIQSFVLDLAAALDVDGGAEANGAPWGGDWFNALLADLNSHEGTSIVVAGDEQPPWVHALVHAINAKLNNAGETVLYTESVQAEPVNQVEQLAELVDEMQSMAVTALFIIEGNPVYDAPTDIPFAEALENVPLSVHLSLYNDETSQGSTWFVPQTHFVEAWSDARAFDGTLSVIQPPISPLYPYAMSAHELLALLLADERSGYQIVRDTWEETYSGDDFEAFWRRTLHNGVADDSTAEAAQPSLSGDFASQIETSATGDGLELILRADPTIWDGRFAFNPWLQELPKPLTKLTWDNAALMSPETANDLGVETEDLVDLTVGDLTMVAPVWVIPGHANNAVTVFFGYGRGLGGDVEAGESFNAYALRTSEAQWTASGLRVASRNETYELASARGKIDLESLGEQYSESPVRTASLAAFMENPDWVNETQINEVVSPYPEVDYSEGYSWGMSIDLSACTGCNACVIACQSENNIPSVGKENVRKAREMHWLRVDRYYEETDSGEVKTHFQPLPCMHCETAPCETVCPVQATIHDSEGLNTMIYNRCIGTRYCSANCPYTVRRFNYMEYVADDSILIEQRNPNVSVRPEGVMEKCTYCVQRISAARISANNDGRAILDGEVMPACATACPAQAISFGNLNDPAARVVEDKAQQHSYGVLAELGTKPRTTYLAKITNPNQSIAEEEE